MINIKALLYAVICQALALSSAALLSQSTLARSGLSADSSETQSENKIEQLNNSLEVIQMSYWGLDDGARKKQTPKVLAKLQEILDESKNHPNLYADATMVLAAVHNRDAGGKQSALNVLIRNQDQINFNLTSDDSDEVYLRFNEYICIYANKDKDRIVLEKAVRNLLDYPYKSLNSRALRLRWEETYYVHAGHIYLAFIGGNDLTKLKAFKMRPVRGGEHVRRLRDDAIHRLLIGEKSTEGLSKAVLDQGVRAIDSQESLLTGNHPDTFQTKAEGIPKTAEGIDSSMLPMKKSKSSKTAIIASIFIAFGLAVLFFLVYRSKSIRGSSQA